MLNRSVRNLLRVSILSAALLGYAPKQALAIGMHNSNITPQSAYLEYAQLFPSVGAMGVFNNGLLEFGGSGVLIDEHWVLTAAHVLLSNNSNPNSTYDAFQFSLGTNFFTDPGETQLADDFFIHPGYVGIENGPDLALLYFENAFTSAAPATLYQGPDVVGDVYDIVGYGQPGTPSTGLQPQDGQKRAGQNKTTSINSPAAGYLRTRFDQPGFPNFLTLGVQGTPGDSGGAWFTDGMLAAITADAGTFRYGGDTTAFRVSLELDWIAEVQASKTSVPEPSTAALLLVGLPFVRRNRRQAR